MAIFTVTNSKGGVGNTPTAVSLSQWLAEKNKVTLVDLDSQGDATKSVGLDLSDAAFNLLDGVPDDLQETRFANLSLVAGGPSTDAIEEIVVARLRVNASAVQSLAGRLAKSLKGFGSDHFVIDTRKTGYVKEMAILSADVVIVPTTLDYGSVSNTIALVQRIAPTTEARIVVLPTLTSNSRKRFNSEAVGMLQDALPGVTVSKLFISRLACIENAGWEDHTLWDDPKCAVLKAAYVEFFESLNV